MHPILLHLGTFALRASGASYVLASIVACLWAYRVARRNGWNAEHVLPGLALVIGAAYLGARLFGAWYVGYRYGTPPSGAFRRGTLGFLGGLALGGGTLVAYLRWKRLPVGRVLDELSPIAPIVYGIFRLGCLLNGDDYGIRTNLPWGMTFPNGSPPTTTRVHPTQLYEMALMVPVFLWLWWRRQRELPPGTVASELCIVLGAERFLVDFWRNEHVLMTGLVASQWMALLLVGIGVSNRFELIRRANVARRLGHERTR